MQNFIVLGIIPGTNFQTDLNFWIYVSIVFMLLINRRRFYVLGKHLHLRFIAWRITQAVNNFDLVAL